MSRSSLPGPEPDAGTQRRWNAATACRAPRDGDTMQTTTGQSSFLQYVNWKPQGTALCQGNTGAAGGGGRARGANRCQAEDGAGHSRWQGRQGGCRRWDVPGEQTGSVCPVPATRRPSEGLRCAGLRRGLPSVRRRGQARLLCFSPSSRPAGRLPSGSEIHAQKREVQAPGTRPSKADAGAPSCSGDLTDNAGTGKAGGPKQASHRRSREQGWPGRVRAEGRGC